jgi:hypothetical protein
MKLAELRENFELQYNLFRNVKAAIGAESYWSVPEVVDFTEVAIPNYIENVQYNNHWGEGPVTAEVGKYNLTWLDLFKIADGLIKMSGDGHHVYIEAFEQEGNDLILYTGS